MIKLSHRVRRARPVPQHEGERGAAIVLFVLVLTVLLILSAIVVDLGFARQRARNQQASVDAAALAGVQDLPKRLSDDPAVNNAKYKKARDAAMATLANSLSDDGAYSSPNCGESEGICARFIDNAQVEVETPYDLYDNWEEDDGHPRPWQLVRVKVCRPTPRFLGQFAGQGSDGIVCREGVARGWVEPVSSGAGLVSLSEHDCEAAKFQGSSEVDLVIYGGGSVLVNSDCPTNALDGGGSAWEVRATTIEVVGGFNITPCTAEDCTPGTTPTSGHEPIDDPFAGIPEPARPSTNGTCYSNIQDTVKLQTVVVCTPGYYANFNWNSNGQVRYLPGVYWIDGSLKITGGEHHICNNLNLTTRTCAGVPDGIPKEPGQTDGIMWFIKNGQVDMSGNAILDLPPPKAPSIYAGISIFMSKTNTSCGTTGTTCKINGTSGSSIGSIYMPNGHLELLGDMSDAGGQAFVTGTVASKTFLVTGNGLVTIDSSAAPPAVRKPDIGLER